MLIAQERMANNHVYVFKKSQPSKYSYVSEVRYVLCGLRKPPVGLLKA